MAETKWVNGVTDPSKWSHNPILMIGRSTTLYDLVVVSRILQNWYPNKLLGNCIPVKHLHRKQKNIGGGCQYMYFFSISYFGKLIHFDYDNFFEKGWFKHQLLDDNLTRFSRAFCPGPTLLQLCC